MPPYEHAGSLVRSNLKFDFSNTNIEYAKIRTKDFYIELKVYCNGKKMAHTVSRNYVNVSINFAIQDTFKSKIEQTYNFNPKNNYYVTFKAYETKEITRFKYIKTPERINSNRRNYIIQERVNLYFD